jgi:rare lipoprotein A
VSALVRGVGLTLLSCALTACGSAPKRSDPPPAADHAPAHDDAAREVAHAPKRSPYPPAQEDPSKRGDYVAGGLYAPHIPDSAPDEIPDVDAIPEPEVKSEPRSRIGNRSYAVMGKRYHVRDSAEGYVEEGMASFYGSKFHGRKTSNHEVYDMYAFSAAHKTLPLPSYVRVTNLANGKSVVVRVNDRGPFHAGRIIDLSYAAATKLGFTRQGTARVEVRALTPEEGRGGRETAARTPPVQTPPVATVEDNAVSADEFERWMRERGIRFASAAATPATSTVPAPAPTAPSPGAEGSEVLLQLASFSARDNAERARDRLSAGGVEPLRIDEATVNGQSVWRLRIGPVPTARVQELSGRAADLGFGSAQIVRD